MQNKTQKILILGLALMLVSVSPVLAEELNSEKAGMTPDSPFYFMDRFGDMFQSSESLADEKVAEAKVMAEKNKSDAMNKALKHYNKAMEKRAKQAKGDEREAEEIAKQSTNHLTILAKVRAKVSEEAYSGLDTAINNSARNRESALEELGKNAPEKAEQVRNQTRQQIVNAAGEIVQEQIKKGLENLETGQEKVSGESQGVPPQSPKA